MNLPLKNNKLLILLCAITGIFIFCMVVLHPLVSLFSANYLDIGHNITSNDTNDKIASLSTDQISFENLTNGSGYIASPGYNNQTLVSQGNTCLPSFPSPEEVQGFLKNHTVPYNAYPSFSRYSFSGSSGTIRVTDCNTTRIWSYTLDTSTFRPDEYLVTASAVTRNATGTAIFNILSGVRTEKIPITKRTKYVPGPGEDYYITIDPVGDRYVGEMVTITGSTNVPPGEDILVQVYSASFQPTDKSDSGEFSGASATTASSGSAAVPEYSTTNNQVAGVDEADIIKTDGTNIYAISGNTVYILRAYPAQDARLITTLTTNGTPIDMYVDNDQLVLFVTESVGLEDICEYAGTGDSYKRTRILIYSITDPSHPMLRREIDADGDYLNSRLIGQFLYFITTKPVNYLSGNITFPSLLEENQMITPEVYNFGQNNTKFSYDMAGAVDISDETPATAITFLTGSDSIVYVSPQNLYLGVSAPDMNGYADKTNLYAFSLDNETIQYKASGTVNGSLINQYSLDEYNGNLRVATNVRLPGYPVHRYSNVFIFDDQLNVTGRVEHIAPDEMMHSTRFMGDRLYMVTFQQLDPFFVINLSDPVNPKILGELKLPGFSDYLHPFDDTHIIGIGQDTLPNSRGDGNVSGGIKLSLFNVSEVTKPTLINSIVLGGAGSSSEVFTDPKAFLFDRQKNLLVLPVFLGGLPMTLWKTQDSNVTFMQNGTMTGASVFGVDPVQGFTNKGTVIHGENSYSEPQVERAIYINDTLYTMSPDQIILTDLSNISHQFTKISLNYSKIT